MQKTFSFGKYLAKRQALLRLKEKLIEEGFGDRLVRSADIAMVCEGTAASRYGLVNKSMKRGELVRLCRGVYVMSGKLRSASISRYYVANQIVRPSVVSFESSLAYHGWIPERVETVSSAVSFGRSRGFDTPLGHYQYVKTPVEPFCFMLGVVHVPHEHHPFLVAKPLRALVDRVVQSRIEQCDMSYLTDGLRIDVEKLEQLTAVDFTAVEVVYRFKRVKRFLNRLRGELGIQ